MAHRDMGNAPTPARIRRALNDLGHCLEHGQGADAYATMIVCITLLNLSVASGGDDGPPVRRIVGIVGIGPLVWAEWWRRIVG